MSSIFEDGLIKGEDGMVRCWWPGDDPLYIQYHDMEWGRPVFDDIRLFEKLCLEGFQAGLSWITILRKRENFRRAFAEFDFEKVARFTEGDVDRLMQDSGIIRHRGKIQAVINNAQRTCELVDCKGSLSKWLWGFAPGKLQRPENINYQYIRDLSFTKESKNLSIDLKKNGFKFVGPTTMYALMQAMGMVNDHLEGCFCRREVERSKIYDKTG